MGEILCIQISLFNDKTREFEGIRFVPVDSPEPNVAVLSDVENIIGPHLLPHFRFCHFYTGDRRGGDGERVPDIEGVLLHFPDEDYSHLPTEVAFDEEVYYPWAKHWTAALAAAGDTGSHRAAAEWMREHDCSEVIQSIDGRFHPATPFAVILEESDVVPA